MFFYTEIEDPLVLVEGPTGIFRFVNAEQQPVKSRGFETNVRLSYDIVKLFAGYTFTHAKAAYLVGNQTLPLTPKSRINSALLFEKEANFKTGFEAYYTSSQFLSDGFRTKRFGLRDLRRKDIRQVQSLYKFRKHHRHSPEPV